MTVYSEFLALQYEGVTSPTPTTLNISSGDTIELGIDTLSYADGNGWFRFGTPTGCTTSATSGVNGGVVTITPTSGATSYSVTFRTIISESGVYYYGRIAGTISTGGTTPTYSVANTSTNEGASATANVTTTNVANGTTLYWTVNATTADVSTTSGSFTISSNAGSFSIPAIADSLTEGTETYTISIRTGSTAGTVVATSTLTINDTSTTPAAATYTLTFYDSSFASTRTNFNEGEGVYTFLSTTAPDGTYYWSTSSGSDLVSPVDGSFAVSSAFGLFNFTISADSVTEGTETLTVYIRSGSVSGTVLASSSITINDTSVAVATPTYSVANASTNEGASATANVTTTNVANGTTLYWTVNATTADVSTTSGSFTISSNAGSFSIPAIADSLTEGTETYTISVRTGSTAGTVVATSTLTINDTSTTPVGPTYSVANASTNEGASATVSVTTTNVANATTLYWTVDATTADVSTTSGNFTINSNAGSFTIPAIADSLTEGSEAYTISVRTGSTVGTVVATSTLTINDTSTAPAIDNTPDAFSFTDVGGATTNTVYTTDNVTITGLQPNYSITVTASGGTVDAGTSALSGTFATSKTVTTDALGSIVVSARVTSSPSAGATVNCVVTIGTLSDTFSVTTFSSGNQVNQFTFTDIDNASFSTVYTSNTITVSGLTPGLSAFVVIGNGTYSKNGGAYVSANGGTVTNGDVITVRGTSSANYSTQVSVILTIYVNSGGIIGANVSDTFAINTPKFNYSLTPNFISIYEGSTIPLVLETIGVANGTTLYWTLNGATTADFSAVSGSFTVNSDTGTFSITALTDALTEGTETYTLAVRSGSTSGTVLTTSTVLVTDPPANAYGMQILDSNGNIVMDTSTYTVKEVKYSVSVTASTSISVPSIISDTVAQVIELSSGTDPLAVGDVSIDYINKLLVVSGGSGFLATINLMDYR